MKICVENPLISPKSGLREDPERQVIALRRTRGVMGGLVILDT